ncbi:hypothetical protein KUTeg_025011 [Tegillarca granosa]|uniref:THO complex subunit 2 n=1 Tax=Tegillarca granosa TaxID=220873 RepID=A0ABQ9E4P8_TEGGR|nr:hypothetical protein KUTeg_025011 [Tegillarca granosa]
MAASCVSIDQCKHWEKTGRSEFLKSCKSLAENNGLWSVGKNSLRRALYELCWHVVKGHLKQEQAVATLNDLTDLVKDSVSLLADIFSVIDIETSAYSDDKLHVYKEKLVSLIAGCESFIPPAVLKERLDQETLENIGLIPSKLTFQQKYVKTKTKLYYKQQKFNLLREESEGYSKLISELNQELTEKVTHHQVVEHIKSLIGCFDLDPNRVLDILLESFECRSDLHSFYVPLFREYVSDQKTLCNILGFRFHFYKGEETPESLYKLAGLLLKHELVDLDSLYPHLAPDDSDIQAYHQKDLDEAKAYAKKLSVVILSDKTDDKKDDENMKIDVHSTNQKIGLCQALLMLGAWSNAKQILDRLPEFFATMYKPVGIQMCNLVHTMIEPLYIEHAGIPRRIMKKRPVQDKDVSEKFDLVKTFRDLHYKVFPIMRYLGPYCAFDAVLVIKLVRLGKTFMTKRQSQGLKPEDDVAYYGFLNMLDEVILPCMALLTCNCCISEELWAFLKLYPYELRYRLYGNWKNDSYNHHAKLIRTKADSLERAKYIMKRLSKENVKPSGRQIGKLSHSNPGILFEYVLSQIQRYDNFIGPVVDSLKFLTSLSYDVLAFCIIEAVANPEKDRMKHDDTNISLWLQSLASFTGSICKKYSVELAGIMQYVANQLKAGKSFDLLLLREVVQKMAGIEISEEITDDQLEAMAGGELLRQEGGYFAQVRNTKKSSTRLKDTLLEHDLALSLCLLMSQQRDSVIFQEGAQSHLKLVGKLYDQCQDTLVQFGSFLSMQLSTEEFVKRLPPIDTLIMEYHVPPDAAFFLCRSQYAYAIATKFDELRKIDKANKQNTSQQKVQRYIEASESVMTPVIDLVGPLFTSKVWEDLSAHFYVTFWSLSMYELAVPTSVYEKQIQQLSSQISAIEDNRDLPQSKKKKEKERCTNLIDKLKDEEKKQGEHVQRVLARLKSQKEQWFISRSTKNETITQFLQLCIFPRCCFTANDAVYCAKFIHILHDLKTPNFSTLICYDRIFCDITYTVTSCTENEAHRYGRFLCTSLETIMRWHSDKTIYEKECASYPGFVTVFRKGTDSNNKADQLDFENYRHVCHKWHFRITKAMVACLESGNYIQIRNALIILTKILLYYPRIAQFGQALERRVDRLRQEEKEKRPDIYALAMGYSGQLKSKKSHWVQETVFHQKDKDAKAGQKANSSQPSKSTEGAKTTDSKAQSKKNDSGSAKTKDVKDKDKKVMSSVEKKEMKSATNHSDAASTSKAVPSSDKKGSKSDTKVKLNVENKKSSENDRAAESGTSKTPKEKEKGKDRERDHEEKGSKNKGHSEDKSEKERSHADDKAKDKISSKESKYSSKEEKLAKESKSRDDRSPHTEGKSKEEKIRIKEERKEERKAEKLEKESRKEERESRKEEKHEKKLKRSSVERDSYREKDSHIDQSNNVTPSTSHGSYHRHNSPESSPRYSDERDVKRRKLEATPSTSKVSMMEVCS